MSLPNVQDEPRLWLARLVLLGARGVTDIGVGSGALFGFLGKRKLKAASNDTSDSEIFIDLFPSQSSPAEFDPNLLKIGVGCIPKPAKARSGKPENTTVVEL